MKIEKSLLPASIVNNHFRAASLEGRIVMLLGALVSVSLIYFLLDRITQFIARGFEKGSSSLATSSAPSHSISDNAQNRDLSIIHPLETPRTNSQAYNPSILLKTCITYLSKQEIDSNDPNGFTPLPSHVAEQWMQEMQPCSLALNPLYLRLFSCSHTFDLTKFGSPFTDEQLKEISAFPHLKTVIIPPYLFKQFLDVLPHEGVKFELVLTNIHDWKHLNELEDAHFEKLAKNALLHPQIAKIFIFFIEQFYLYIYRLPDKKLKRFYPLKHKLLNFCWSWIAAGGLKQELLDRAPLEDTKYYNLYPYIKCAYLRNNNFLRKNLVNQVLKKIWVRYKPTCMYSVDTSIRKRALSCKDLIESIIQFIASAEEPVPILLELLEMEYHELAPFMYSLLSKYITEEQLEEIDRLTEKENKKRTAFSNVIWKSMCYKVIKANIYWIKVFNSYQKLDNLTNLFGSSDQDIKQSELNRMTLADNQIQTSEYGKLNPDNLHLFSNGPIFDFSHFNPFFTDSQIQEVLAIPKLKKLVIPTALEYSCLVEQVLRLVDGKVHIEITLEITDLNFLNYLDSILLKQLACRLTKHHEEAYNVLEIGTIFFNRAIPHWEKIQPKHAAAMNAHLENQSEKNFFCLLDFWIKEGGLTTNYPRLKEKLPFFLAYIISAMIRTRLLDNEEKKISEKWLWIQPIIEPAIQFIVSAPNPIVPLLFLLAESYTPPPSEKSISKLLSVSGAKVSDEEKHKEEESDEELVDHSCEEFMHAQFSKYLNPDLVDHSKKVQSNRLQGSDFTFSFPLPFKYPFRQLGPHYLDMGAVNSYEEFKKEGADVQEFKEEEPDEEPIDRSCEEFMHAQFSKYLNPDLVDRLKKVQLNRLKGSDSTFFFPFKDLISQRCYLNMDRVISHLELIKANGHFKP